MELKSESQSSPIVIIVMDLKYKKYLDLVQILTPAIHSLPIYMQLVEEMPQRILQEDLIMLSNRIGKPRVDMPS